MKGVLSVIVGVLLVLGGAYLAIVGNLRKLTGEERWNIFAKPADLVVLAALLGGLLVGASLVNRFRRRGGRDDLDPKD